MARGSIMVGLKSATMAFLGFMLLSSSAIAFVDEDLPVTKVLADAGVDDAMFEMGLRYYKGDGVKQSYSNAFYMINKSAKKDYGPAQDLVGLMYEEGTGVEKNPKAAFEWYEISARQGSSLGQHHLATAYYNGTGVENDYTKAFEWFEKSAHQGLSVAQHDLGVMYNNGQGVIKDKVKALEWFDKSCIAGNKNGCAAKERLATAP